MPAAGALESAKLGGAFLSHLHVPAPVPLSLQWKILDGSPAVSEVAVPVVAEIPAAVPETAESNPAQAIEVSVADVENEHFVIARADDEQPDATQSATQTPEPETPALANVALTATAVAAATAAAVVVGVRARRILQRRQVLRFS